MGGKSVRLFLVDGTSGGLVTAEIMNWTGQLIAGPRTDLPALVKREESRKTGIYLLLGEDPASPGGTIAYIGESDDVAKRLVQHARPETSGGKDFWNRAVVLTSKDMNLTKAHARYLESRLIVLAAAAGRAKLANGNNPPPVALPEADRSDMEYFIDQAKIVLPVLGINLLRSTKAPPVASSTSDDITPEASPVFRMISKRAAVDATAQEIDGEFIVREGSQARREWMSGDHSYKKLRLQLEGDGTLVLASDGLTMTFSHDCVFASPSAASATVLGRASNGRLDWKVDGTATTYAEWQESLLAEAIKESSEHG